MELREVKACVSDQFQEGERWHWNSWGAENKDLNLQMTDFKMGES